MRFSYRFIVVTILTFLIGLGVVSLWFIYQRPVVSQTQNIGCFTGFNVEKAGVGFASTLYFPPTIFSEIEGRDDVSNRYAEFLISMHEPSFLVFPDCVEESYRFLWIRTFHQPVSVRIWKSGAQFFLTIKKLDGQGGYDIGKLKFEETRSLSEDEWVTFNKLLNQASFWMLPSLEKSPSTYDGASWVLEGYKKKQYHLVDRHSPNDETYKAVCIYLLKMSGSEIDATHPELY